MASIPLPALHVETQQQSPLQQYAMLSQIQNAQQQRQLGAAELQQRNIQTQEAQLKLQDTQATTAAMKEWDGKNPDDLPPLVLKNGGSSTAVFGLKNQILDWKTKAANLSKDQLDNLDKTNNIIAGHFEAVKNADDKQGAYTSAIADLQKNGLAQQGQFPPQYPGDDWLDQQEKQHMGQKAIVEQAQKEKELQQKQQELDLKSKEFQSAMPGGPKYPPTMAETEATNPKIQGAKVAVAAAEGAARANIEHQFATKNNAALSDVPTHLVGGATAAAEKANNEFADAKSVADRMQATMDAAKKGNVVAYQIIPQEGTLQITTSQGVHRINRTEIEQYSGGGSLWQRMEGHFGKALTGESIPDSVLKDMQDIQDIQRQGSVERYKNKLKAVNQTYGSKFTPVEMEGLTPKMIRARDPQGVLHEAKEGTPLPQGWKLE